MRRAARWLAPAEDSRGRVPDQILVWKSLTLGSSALIPLRLRTSATSYRANAGERQSAVCGGASAHLRGLGLGVIDVAADRFEVREHELRERLAARAGHQLTGESEGLQHRQVGANHDGIGRRLVLPAPVSTAFRGKAGERRVPGQARPPIRE